MQLDVLRGIAFGRQLNRAGEAQELLDRQADQRWIGPQALELFGVLEQRERATGDEVHGRFMARDEQQHDHREQLVRAQPVARIFSLEQRREQVVAWPRPAPREEPPQVPQEEPRGGQRK